MNTYREFPNAQAARDYRHENGTGGWIFERETDKRALLFPPEFTPSVIFNSPLTRSQNGRLIGSM